jgi:hypothetical protein
MNGSNLTLGVIAAIIAAKVKKGSKFKDTSIIDDQAIARMTGIPQEDWYAKIDKPFENARVMDMLTRNMFINDDDYFCKDMVFEAENIGQFYDPSLDPIAFYATKINQPGVKLVTSQDMDIKGWLLKNSNLDRTAISALDSRLLFMIQLSNPELPLSLETSYLIADTVGPVLYHDVLYNLLM